MKKMQKLVDRFKDSTTLGDLDMQETSAFVDLLILTVMIDGEITEEELQGLADQWNQLPFAGDDTLEILVGEQGFETRQWLEDNANKPEELDAFLAKTADKISRPDAQEAAVRMIAIVSESDGFDEHEAELCYQLGGHFDMDRGEVDELIDSIYD